MRVIVQLFAAVVILSIVESSPPFRIDGDSHAIQDMKHFTMDNSGD